MQLVLTCAALLLLVAAAELRAPKYYMAAAPSYRKRTSIQKIFEKNNFTIIPDGELDVIFNERAGSLDPGDRLCPSDTVSPPVLSFDSEDGCDYAFLCLNMDYPCAENPYLAPGLIALYGRVNVDENVGDTCDIAPWIPPTPPVGTGVHRFVFYVIELREPLDRNDPDLECYKFERLNFPIEHFLKKYGSGRLFGTFMTMEYCCGECEEEERKERYRYSRFDY